MNSFRAVVLALSVAFAQAQRQEMVASSASPVTSAPAATAQLISTPVSPVPVTPAPVTTAPVQAPVAPQAPVWTWNLNVAGADTTAPSTPVPVALQAPVWAWNLNIPNPATAAPVTPVPEAPLVPVGTGIADMSNPLASSEDGAIGGSGGSARNSSPIVPEIPAPLEPVDQSVSSFGAGDIKSNPGCAAPTRFETDVFVTYTGTGSITLAELDQLDMGFRDSYNALQAVGSLCDPLSRRVDFVNINQNDGFFGAIPPDNTGPFITYRFLVSGSCCGCDPNAELFSPTSGDIDDDSGGDGAFRGRKSIRRHLQSGCAPRPPKEVEMQVAFDSFVQRGQSHLGGPFSNVRRIVVTDEVEEVRCSSRVNEFRTIIFVDFIGAVESLTPSELKQLIDSFLNTYNDLSDITCDPSFRRANSIVADFDPDMNANIEEGFRLTFFVTGFCRECPADSLLFSPSCTSSRAVDLDVTRNAGLSEQSPPIRASGGVRKLQTLDDTCYCTRGADIGAPCESDFEQSYKAAVQTLFLPNIGSVENIEEEDRTLAPASIETRPPVSPTVGPVVSPSDRPTTAMTDPPSSSPSKSPTKPPTVSPSESPSHFPSRGPSINPSGEPSFIPTDILPSARPSLVPTGTFPSAVPSPSPSQASEVPSISPTRSPIFTPTMEPSDSPRPSPSPSKTPTLSDAPSRVPSQAPSQSFFPSGPSAAPSKSDAPTDSPVPSPSPSQTPSTGAPSITGRPTPLESLSPSITQSGMPTITDSPSDSRPPSQPPTESPGPSPAPSEGVPTTTPTDSIAPTGPTNSPVPSNGPTATPSFDPPTESPAPSPAPSAKPSGLIPSAVMSVSQQPSPTAPTAPSFKPSASPVPTSFSDFLQVCYAALVTVDTDSNRRVDEIEFLSFLEIMGYDLMGATAFDQLPIVLMEAFVESACASDAASCESDPFITNQGAKTEDNATFMEEDVLNFACGLIRAGIQDAQ